MARPRKAAAQRVLGPLGEASSRLQLLEKAGLTPERAAGLLRKIVAEAEAAVEGAMNPLSALPVPDYHARMSAGKLLIQLLGANPPKTSAPANGPAQVAVVIEMPAWARPAPLQAKARVIPTLPANTT
jgi:hypothetical protein